MRLSRKSALLLLGLAAGASDAEIRSAYRGKVRELHPDVGGDPEALREVLAAYELLSPPGAAEDGAPRLRQPWLVTMSFAGTADVVPMVGTSADPPSVNEQGYLRGCVWASTAEEAGELVNRQREALIASGSWSAGGDEPFMVSVSREGKTRYCEIGSPVPSVPLSISLDGLGFLSGWVWASSPEAALAQVLARRRYLLENQEWPPARLKPGGES